jgi:hypothetical protein
MASRDPHDPPTPREAPIEKKPTRPKGRMTVPKFAALKGSGQKITMVTAYDFPFARLVDQAGVEAVLVGDSMSMVVQGHDNTLPVTLDEMIYHAEMVGRAVENALLVVDMPFPSYHLGTYKAIENAGRILKETRCQAVKLEGGADQADTIHALVSAGIPVMAHAERPPTWWLSSAARRSGVTARCSLGGRSGGVRHCARMYPVGHGRADH